jgi:hypothetical protein
VRISSFSSSTARKFQPGARTATRPDNPGPPAGRSSLPAYHLADGTCECIGGRSPANTRCRSCRSAALSSVPHGTRGG